MASTRSSTKLNLSMRPLEQATVLQHQHDSNHERQFQNRTQQRNYYHQQQQRQQQYQLISNLRPSSITRPITATVTTTPTATTLTNEATKCDHREPSCINIQKQQQPQDNKEQKQIFSRQQCHQRHQQQCNQYRSHQKGQGKRNRENFENTIRPAHFNTCPKETVSFRQNLTLHHHSSFFSKDIAKSSMKQSRYSSTTTYIDKGNICDGKINGKVSSSASVSILDDPGEHFNINFHAADSPTHGQRIRAYNCDNSGVIINLPLSCKELELLTKDEENKQAIYLSKTHASLISTREELPQEHQIQKHQRPLPCNRKNNSSSPKVYNNKNSIGQILKRNSCCSETLQTGDASINKLSILKPGKHQQHRRSLQLNYHNNLFGSVRESSNRNDNSKGGNNTNNNLFFPSVKLRQSRFDNPKSSVSGKAPAAARAQHAYSWYAPVSSALEEELEQNFRDSSPVHNLANIKKLHLNHNQDSNSVRHASAINNEADALLDTCNQIDIQLQLHLQAPSKGNSVGARAFNEQKSSLQPPKSLPLPLTLTLPHSATTFAGNSTYVSRNTVVISGDNCSEGSEGPHATRSSDSLGLAGGPLPRIKRWENFVKHLFTRPSSNDRVDSQPITATPASNPADGEAIDSRLILHNFPASPKIHVTRTQSVQNIVADHPSGYSNAHSGSDKLTNGFIRGSSSSLNVVHQKLWNIIRREGSAASLYQEKSNSIVQYRSMRKCETVLALTRQTTPSICSPVLNLSSGAIGGAASTSQRMSGSGIFSASGVQQIRPLNRLRKSVSNINATCSRCSSLLSLAASGSRYSINIAPNGASGTIVSIAPSATTSAHNYLENPSLGRRREQRLLLRQQKQPHLHQQNHNFNYVSDSLNNLSSPSCGEVIEPSKRICNSSQFYYKTSAASSITSPPSNDTTVTFTSSSVSTSSTPTKISDRNKISPRIEAIGIPSLLLSTSSSISSSSSSVAEEATKEKSGSVHFSNSIMSAFSKTSSKILMKSERNEKSLNQEPESTQQTSQLISSLSSILLPTPFQMFTCKLCLVDVDSAEDATTLKECSCQFCTECMKAYIEFEISEGAYEISCPDALCPAQGVITLPEIEHLTTANLVKKHYRYRLNREIELDKSRTWCPRPGCETVCMVRPVIQNDAFSLSASTSRNALVILGTPERENENGNEVTSTTTSNPASSNALCSVQCPSCKDEFCSACKKAWHPNINCEENSRRLVADGEDDIGIPFGNDLIKCCPMCGVPIEKDEGCAQMMCKRCKHVFCWYCLASLDDDFLLRHYDKGPCKNKLGHSRASVVWHRAQVIGIFAGFGILLLVASPLLLLAAPCIICCKCRICSGSKTDEVGGELDDAATTLQS